MKKLVSMVLSLLLIVSLFTVTPASAGALSKEVQAMIEKGVLSEKTVLHQKVNRGEFATYISRALDLPTGKHQFTDVKQNSPLAPGINAAAQAGIIKGITSTKFEPNQLITREQMAMMMDRALSYLKIEEKLGNIHFTDQKDQSPLATKAISNMVGHGLILGYSNNTFRPKENATHAHSAAFIYRMLEVYNNQQKPTEPENPEIPPEATKLFTIGKVDSKGNITTENKTYKTFNAANTAFTNADTQVILQNDKIIKMNKGIVVAKTEKAGNATNVYQSDMKTVILGVQYGTELEYITSDEGKITVKSAGQLGYVKHTDAYLQPEISMKGRSYYSVDNKGNLKHTIYYPLSNTSAAYIYGKAPAQLKPGVTYFSWDGSTFTTKDGTTVGPFYQYFNMLPYRTSTNYSAAELDAIIMKKLAEKEDLYNSNPKLYARYKDAKTKSKLIGIGQTLKDFEQNHKMNALIILGKGISESDYGMSTIAQKENNIFGLNVVDSGSTNRKTYESIAECINELSTSFINKNYVPLTGRYANSGILGNKLRGVNVRYATDPYWGQKIAGHMYQLDIEMGGKDFVNNPTPYQIYESNEKGLNVRTGPTTAANKLYTYPKVGYVFVVVGTNNSWYQILSDNLEDKYGYISSQYADLLPIVR